MSLTLSLWHVRATALGVGVTTVQWGETFFTDITVPHRVTEGRKEASLVIREQDYSFRPPDSPAGLPLSLSLLSPLLQPHTGQGVSAVLPGHRGSSVCHPDRCSLCFYRGPDLWFQQIGTQREFLHCGWML